MAEQENNWYAQIGSPLGGIAALIAFVGVMLAACNEAGWVIGSALGWIPAGIAAAITYVLFRWLWIVFVIAGFYLYDYVQGL